MPHHGRCHCAAIEVTFETSEPIERWAPRACACRFCRLHAARTVTDPRGTLSLRAREETLVRYRFDLRTADFMVCGRCGVYVAVVVDDAFASLNVRVLDDFTRVPDVETIVRYDGESAQERLARRRGRWTPTTVELTRASA